LRRGLDVGDAVCVLEELLGLELKELMESDIEFDVGLTGFSIAEVDQLVEG
jgi:hypothetical protein